VHVHQTHAQPDAIAVALQRALEHHVHQPPPPPLHGIAFRLAIARRPDRPHAELRQGGEAGDEGVGEPQLERVVPRRRNEETAATHRQPPRVRLRVGRRPPACERACLRPEAIAALRNGLDQRALVAEGPAHVAHVPRERVPFDVNIRPEPFDQLESSHQLAAAFDEGDQEIERLGRQWDHSAGTRQPAFRLLQAEVSEGPGSRRGRRPGRLPDRGPHLALP
jgi:hypothetical protein